MTGNVFLFFLKKIANVLCFYFETSIYEVSRVEGWRGSCFFFVCMFFLFCNLTWNLKDQFFLAVGYQLDDEPNLYLENGWKSPNIPF